MKFKKYLSAILVLLLGIIIGLTINKYRYRQYNEIDNIIKLIEDYSFYFEEKGISRDDLLEGALKGIVDRLDDPYSVYLDEEDLIALMESINANFAGVGVTIAQTGNYSVIMEVFKESPAAEAGLQVGDVILSVDKKPVYGLSTQEISALIRGAVGTKREIKIMRANKEETFEVELDLVEIQTVSYDFVQKSGKSIGYIEVTNFASNTFEAFKDALNKLEAKGVSDVIIDVRGNPGGLLSTVMDMIDRLTDKDSPLLYRQYPNGQLIPEYQNRYQKSMKDEGEPAYNLYILINEYSASASEVFAAALNELEDVPLIGKQTYGKGIVQEIYRISRKKERAVKLTTSAWLTPEQNSIQGVGVAPTIDVDYLNPFSLIDFELQVEVDTVNPFAQALQRFLNHKEILKDPIREDGYIDQQTIDAIAAYQRIIIDDDQLLGNDMQLGQLDFTTIYHVNREIIGLVKNLKYDSQYQQALDLITTGR